MHTVDELDADGFRYLSNGQAVPRAEVMPAIGIEDRLGVVMGDGTDGLGAGNFVLSCVIDFYETLRARKADFFEYPDFYTFQATTAPADYRMFDIYPDHKNVVTEPDPEAILRAVNDRAIDVLVLPDQLPGGPAIEDVTRRSAERGIESCFLYSLDGTLADPDFVIETPKRPVVEWFETTAESAGGDLTGDSWPIHRDENDRLSQAYRRLPLDRALDRFHPQPST